MRRKDREITDFDDIVSVMKRCDVCRLALNDEDVPYILPLNFGMDVEGKNITLYFHGADEGKKYGLIKKDNRVSFEMDCSHRLIADEAKGYCTMEFESVIGTGTVEIVPQEDKYDALRILMKQYHEDDFPFGTDVIPRTTVMKLTVSELTGKRLIKKKA